jgi:hypothetical protein
MGLFSEELTDSATAADDVTKRLIDMANATARLTGVDQNSIKATQAKLATFQDLAKSADEVGGNFDPGTMAALDLQQPGLAALRVTLCSSVRRCRIRLRVWRRCLSLV